ncbi:putative penicillin-binding protein [Rickettsiales endosymbiont of Paramecium tredecaurelia]|uniref:serine hydrolase domain-containing protein n=1 Tax=Candidatus Sarmatiella mevalonica TaxID=2770581 RepID=UPI0019245F07|nr:serine hydrolase domain-containing protein [Candidatus Sarmatiella mevalonica]MBL3284516.1 putative penicillin-binding protein [Candidatus Sarmatiella mevalonica]
MSFNGNITAISNVRPVAEDLLLKFPDIHGNVIVAKQDQVLYHKSFTSHGNIKADKNAQYLIASLTKNFTSVAVLKLLFEHFGDDISDALNKPLSDFLFEDHTIWQDRMPDFAKVISIHHLLSHTSGLDAIHKPLLYSPGERYHYSNLGYILIGHIIQALTSEPIDSYYKRALFDPAGMQNTFLVLDGTPASLQNDPAFVTLVPGFEKNGDQIQKIADKPDFSKLFTAGGIISTPIDLVKWQHALYQGRIIPLKLLQLMTHPVIEKSGFAFYDGEGSLYAGYGVDVLDNGKTRLYQHCGGTSGYQSKISYDPKTQIGIINLSNIMEENPSIFAFTNQLRNMISNINDETEDAK